MAPLVLERPFDMNLSCYTKYEPKNDAAKQNRF